MLAEIVDGVIGVDIHRDFNQVEIAYPSGAMIATCSFSNDSVGYAQTLAWVFEHAPGPGLVILIEGTHSYGVGLARAAATAGLPVIKAEQPIARTAGGGVSPTRSTRTWLVWSSKSQLSDYVNTARP
jgi:transposase